MGAGILADLPWWLMENDQMEIRPFGDLKAVGFFNRDDLTRRLESGDLVPPHEQAGILRYLESGASAAVLPGLVYDLLSQEEQLIGPDEVLVGWAEDMSVSLLSAPTAARELQRESLRKGLN